MNLVLERAAHQSIAVGMGELIVSTDPQTELVCLGLGSCVAICVYAPRRHVAAMAHVVLPTAQGRPVSKPAKYAETVVPYLLEQLKATGVPRSEMRIALCGGAAIFPPLSEVMDIGGRNVLCTREAIQKARLNIVHEDVGGRESRTVKLHVGTGEITLRMVKNGEHLLVRLGE